MPTELLKTIPKDFIEAEKKCEEAPMTTIGMPAQYFVKCELVTGLYLAIGKTKKTWILRYRTKENEKWISRALKLATYPGLSVDSARKMAVQEKINISLGHDPNETRKKYGRQRKKEYDAMKAYGENSVELKQAIEESKLLPHIKTQFNSESEANEYAMTKADEAYRAALDFALSRVAED